MSNSKISGGVTSWRKALLLGSAALLAVSAPHMAMAQAAAAPAAAAAETNADGEAVAEIVVTGSSIRGVAPTGSALLSVTRDIITATAPANTKEMLSAMPQLGNFGANAEQSTANRFRTAGFNPNIHNLGIYATLTLLNGHRIARKVVFRPYQSVLLKIDRRGRVEEMDIDFVPKDPVVRPREVQKSYF